jgi:hypothetical protein
MFAHQSFGRGRPYPENSKNPKNIKISLSEDSAKGIYSDTTVATTIIEDSSTVQLSRQQYKKIIEDAASLSSRRQKT